MIEYEEEFLKRMYESFKIGMLDHRIRCRSKLPGRFRDPWFLHAYTSTTMQIFFEIQGKFAQLNPQISESLYVQVLEFLSTCFVASSGLSPWNSYVPKSARFS